jgi:hypothetical protein
MIKKQHKEAIQMTEYQVGDRFQLAYNEGIVEVIGKKVSSKPRFYNAPCTFNLSIKGLSQNNNGKIIEGTELYWDTTNWEFGKYLLEVEASQIA